MNPFWPIKSWWQLQDCVPTLSLIRTNQSLMSGNIWIYTLDKSKEQKSRWQGGQLLRHHSTRNLAPYLVLPLPHLDVLCVVRIQFEDNIGSIFFMLVETRPPSSLLCVSLHISTLGFGWDARWDHRTMFGGMHYCWTLSHTVYIDICLEDLFIHTFVTLLLPHPLPLD